MKFFGAIVAPLREEASSVARLCHDINDIDANFSSALYERDGVEIPIIIAHPYQMGSTNSAAIVSYLISRFDFNYIGITGICGGLGGNFNERANIGDVVFADSVIKFENSKIYDDEYRSYFDFQSYAINEDTLYNFLVFLRSPTGRKARKMLREASGSYHHGGRPDIVVGPMVSTDSVIKSARYAGIISARANKVLHSGRPLAVEMEFAGAFEACRYANKEKSLFMVRGVNDLADDRKYLQQADNRTAASDNAALVTLEFLRHLADTKSGIYH